MKNLIVIIPIYKQSFNSLEIVSLKQAFKILCNYDISFIAPESLDTKTVLQYGEISIEYFEDYYFKNTKSYSELLLSTNFYNRFIKYEYMLIYQLDAFVFKDNLESFFELNLDYIGAPMQRYGENWKDIKCNIGNGGLSLRKIKSCLNVLKEKDNIYANMPKSWNNENRFLIGEDLFWSFASTLKFLDFKVASFSVAINFSVGTDIAHVYNKMPKWLPFGCHSWSRYDYWFWKEIIETFGYRLPRQTGNSMYSHRKHLIGNYLLERVLKYKHDLKRICSLKEEKIAIWGYGKYGKILEKICIISNIHLEYVFDIKFPKCSYGKYIFPSEENIKKHRGTFLLSVYDKQNEMFVFLRKCNIPEENVLLIGDIFKNFASEYVRYFIVRR